MLILFLLFLDVLETKSIAWENKSADQSKKTISSCSPVPSTFKMSLKCIREVNFDSKAKEDATLLVYLLIFSLHTEPLN